MYFRYCILIVFSVLCLTACRTDEVIYPSEVERVAVTDDGSAMGLYLLNEGNMGSNKATIDYLSFGDGTYTRNLYGERNPQVVKELGDVGNDLQIYGNRLYAVINCSHKVEVMDLHSCKRIGQVDIPNCRYIQFYEDKAYVSAYVGPVGIDPNAQQGAVYEVDTATLKIDRKVTVGYQPEQLVVTKDYIYVANSGGYRAPDYDSTVSVINRLSMKQVRKLPVAINLSQLHQDRYGQLWVVSRGDNGREPAKLFVLKDEQVIDTLDIQCRNICMAGDSLYYFGMAPSGEKTYGIINVRTHEVLPAEWITDGTELQVPYGLLVNPINKDVYVTDAKNYVSSGLLLCFSAKGELRWKVRTGDIPACMCLVDN